MDDFKISIITVAYNAGRTIERCVQSVIEQDYENLEYIVIDGASTDDTLAILQGYSKQINVLISEPDNGIYHAMNKGITLAQGEVIGILNADDYFAGNKVVSQIAASFSAEHADIVYGDLDYVTKHNKVTRRWRSGLYHVNRFNFGWMPPHPAFYCRAALYKKYGLYDPEFGTAADYELMLRLMHMKSVCVRYLPIVMVKMEIGGASNKSLINRVKVLLHDFKAMQVNNIRHPLFALLLKPLRKLKQYF